MNFTQFDPQRTRFMAKMNNTKLFTSILKAIQIVESAAIQVSDLGLRVLVDDSRSLQSSVYIKKTDPLFTEFHFLSSDSIPHDETDHFTIKINFKILIEHLNILSEVESTLQIIYKGDGAPLTLISSCELENMSNICEIKIRNLDSFLEIDFTEENCPCTIKFKGQDFYRMIDDLHRSTPQVEQIEISISPSTPHFCIRALGSVDIKSSYSLTRTSDVVTYFRSTEPVKFRYKWTLLKLALKTLSLAMASSIEIDKNGILCIKSTITDDVQNQSCQVIVEYLILAILNDGEL